MGRAEKAAGDDVRRQRSRVVYYGTRDRCRRDGEPDVNAIIKGGRALWGDWEAGRGGARTRGSIPTGDTHVIWE